jgi:hypothetical protein
MVLSTIFNTLVILHTISGTLTINFCKYSFETIQNKTLREKVIPKGLHKLATVCLDSKTKALDLTIETKHLSLFKDLTEISFGLNEQNGPYFISDSNAPNYYSSSQFIKTLEDALDNP